MLKRDKSAVTIRLLSGTDTVVIGKSIDSTVFVTTPDSLIISREALIIILNYMIKNDILHPKVIEGILEETHTL